MKKIAFLTIIICFISCLFIESLFADEITVISKTTSAATALVSINKECICSTFRLDNDLQTGVVITLKRKNSDGTYKSIVYQGTTLTLSESTTEITVYSVGEIYIDKPVSTTTTGVIWSCIH